jgi:hypothetical protein
MSENDNSSNGMLKEDITLKDDALLSMHWSKDIESILDTIRQNSVLMNEEHKKRYVLLKSKLRYFRLPVIVIAGINSVVSVGFQPYAPQGTISAITCLLSLTCGIIGSIELYLAIQQQMESELIASKDYYTLSTRIYAMLILDSENRKIDGMDFFEEIFADYNNLMQSSIIIYRKITDKLMPVEDINVVKNRRKKMNSYIIQNINPEDDIKKFYEMENQNNEEFVEDV